MLNVVRDITNIWPDDMRLTYNGTALSITGVVKSKSNSKVQNIIMELGSGASAHMLKFMVGLQGQQMSVKWLSAEQVSSSRGLLSVHAKRHNMSMVLGESDVAYTVGTTKTAETYERTDHAAHLFMRSMCNTQTVKEKENGQDVSRFIVVCTKAMLKNKLQRLEAQQSKGGKKATNGWFQLMLRLFTNKLGATESYAGKIVLRTSVLGALSKFLELCVLINSVAMSAHLLGRCFLRPPTVDRAPVRQRLSLRQMHHVAAYTSFPSLLLGQLIFTVEQDRKSVV
jgi:hypothetical protein